MGAVEFALRSRQATAHGVSAVSAVRRDPRKRGRSPRFCRGALLSRFGGTATMVPASDYVSTFRGEGVEPDLVALPVGLRFYA
jgi:hypothetical protein